MTEFDLEALRTRQAQARAQAAQQLTNTTPPTPTTPPHLNPQAIAACTLCDNTGYRGTTICDHTDHTQTAKRGIALIRKTMGWNHRDETRDETPTPSP